MKLKFDDSRLDAQPIVYDLYDVRCQRNFEFYSANGDEGTFNTITFVPGILSLNGEEPLQMPWRKQDWGDIKNAGASTVSAMPEKGRITDSYFEDEKGKIITKVKPNKEVTLVLKTNNLAGKTATIDLSDDEIDYEYNGTYLENDLLENIAITSDYTKIKLKTLKQKR